MTQEGKFYKASFYCRFTTKEPIRNHISTDDLIKTELYDMECYHFQKVDDVPAVYRKSQKFNIEGVQAQGYDHHNNEFFAKVDLEDVCFSKIETSELQHRNGRTFGMLHCEIYGVIDHLFEHLISNKTNQRAWKRKHNKRKSSYSHAERKKGSASKATDRYSGMAMSVVLFIFSLNFFTRGLGMWGSIFAIGAILSYLLRFQKSYWKLGRLASLVKVIRRGLVTFIGLAAIMAIFILSGSKDRKDIDLASVDEPDWLTYSYKDQMPDTSAVFPNPNAIYIEKSPTAKPCNDSGWVEQELTFVWHNDQPVKLHYLMSSNSACYAARNREQLVINDYEEKAYFYAVYRNLCLQGSDSIKSLFQVYDRARVDLALDYEEFCQFIFRSIQYIPYTLVIPGNCSQCRLQGDFDCDDHCVSGTRFGILSPPEFMYTRLGDCDTRTVTLLMILRYFNYDAVILNCDDHSMLGVSIPAFTGESFTYMSKKYYFWETTSTGWGPGMMPPSGKTKKWYVALSTDDLPQMN